MKTLISLSLIAISAAASAQQYTTLNLNSYTTVSASSDLPAAGQTINFDGIPFTLSGLNGASPTTTGQIEVNQYDQYPGVYVPAPKADANTVYLLMSGNLTQAGISLQGFLNVGGGSGISAFNVASDNVIDTAYFQNGHLSSTPGGTELSLVKIVNSSAQPKYSFDGIIFTNSPQTSSYYVSAITTSTPEPSPILAGLCGISVFGFVAKRKRARPTAL